MKNNNVFSLSIRSETIIFIVLAVIAFLLRLNQLSADPPIGLSISQDVHTDPAQYVSFARNMVLYGSFNPLYDYRLIFFLKSAVTLVAYLIFKIAGVGCFQANMVGLFFSFPTIILLYFALRKTAGNIAALFYLLFIAVDYNQIFFGRLSFLENSLNFFAILAFTILIFSRRAYSLILSGLFLATGIFFGKIIGMIYLFPFFCYFAYEYLYNRCSNSIKSYRPVIFFSLGFITVLMFWYFFSYRPAVTAVGGYLHDQAVGLYGTPDAFNSIMEFIKKYVSLGAESFLFKRMAIPALLAWGMILVFFYRIGLVENWRNKLNGLTPGIIFLITLVIGAYGTLMIWNYRPLRYQTILIYPIYALAGYFISEIFLRSRSRIDKKGYILFPAVLFIFLLIPIYQITYALYKSWGATFEFGDNIIVVFIPAVLITIISIIGKSIVPKAFPLPYWFKYTLTALALTICIIPSGINYFKWSSSAAFTTVANSKDLATILSPGAVVSGPYAAVLTQENKLFNFIHMFGVASVDMDFFKKYPVTHLLLDKSNKELVEKNYPEIFAGSRLITSYRVLNRTIHLYLLAGTTGNSQADSYQPSDFEEAVNYFELDEADLGNRHMKTYMMKNPDNISGNYLAFCRALDFKMYSEAEFFFKRAIEFSPTDFYLHYRLGEFYIERYDLIKDNVMKRNGLEQLSLAIKYNPTSKMLASKVAKLSGKEGID